MVLLGRYATREEIRAIRRGGIVSPDTHVLYLSPPQAYHLESLPPRVLERKMQRIGAKGGGKRNLVLMETDIEPSAVVPMTNGLPRAVYETPIYVSPL